MEVKSAEFVMSNSAVDKCPNQPLPEYAFIGRSNVGKSSLISTFVSRHFSEVVPGIMTRVRLPPAENSCITTIVDSQGGDAALISAVASISTGAAAKAFGPTTCWPGCTLAGWEPGSVPVARVSRQREPRPGNWSASLAPSQPAASRRSTELSWPKTRWAR